MLFQALADKDFARQQSFSRKKIRCLQKADAEPTVIKLLSEQL